MEGFKDTNKWLRFGLSAVVALVLLFAMVFEISVPLPIFETQAPEPVTSIGAQAVRERISIDSRDDVYLFNGADLYMYSDDHSTQKFHADGATGNLATAGNVTTGNFLSIGAQTAISVTAGATITPTGTFQPLESSGAVTTSTSEAVADGSSVGDLLILMNTNASDIITIDGTGGNVECKADVALGAGDTLFLIWEGDDWYCLSGYDNS